MRGEYHKEMTAMASSRQDDANHQAIESDDDVLADGYAANLTTRTKASTMLAAAPMTIPAKRTQSSPPLPTDIPTIRYPEGIYSHSARRRNKSKALKRNQFQTH